MAQDETTRGKQETVRFRLDEASVLHAVKNIDKVSYAEHMDDMDSKRKIIAKNVKTIHLEKERKKPSDR